MSTTFTNNLIGLLKTAVNLPDPHSELTNPEAEKTTGRYYSYVTMTSAQFYAIATSLSADSLTDVPASSTVVFEVDSNNNVSGWYNDETFTLAGCNQTSCTVDDYTRELEKTVIYTDMPTVCQSTAFT